MSRLKQFTRSMISSYALLLVNILYTLASVPLTLKYLTKAEFGLWALTLQIANYIALVDLGMGSSVARILIDHKDERSNGRYGGALKSGFLVGLAQAGIILVVGLAILKLLAIGFRVDFGLTHSFYWLMAGQVLLTAAAFGTRILGQILYAWQRIDISNYAGTIQLPLTLAFLWIGFVSGFGIYSLLLGAFAGFLFNTIFSFWGCVQLELLPKRGEWGRASKEQFRELFGYGVEVFLISIGTQLIISSQTMLVFRVLGAEAAALWSVMTKVFTLVTQIVWKIIGNAMPAFAEMHVRQEWGRFWERYRQFFIGTNVFAGMCAVLFVACNSSFVEVWTHGKFSWPPINNFLLAIWLVLQAQQCCHNSIVMTLKAINTLKYVFVLEGIMFVAIALMILPSTGITGMLECSVAATLVFTWLTGLLRIAKLSAIKPYVLLWDWQKPLMRLLVVVLPLAIGLKLVLSSSAQVIQLVGMGLGVTVTSMWVAMRYALPRDLILEVAEKMPRPLRNFIPKTSGKVQGAVFL